MVSATLSARSVSVAFAKVPGIDPTVFVHPHALIEKGARIGPRTRVWAFSHILSSAVVGSNCNICDHTFIEGKVHIGDFVTIKSGVYLWEGVHVEDNVFIGPAAVFTNDLRPRSKQRPDKFATILLKKGCSIGANATLLSGIEIGCWAMIGAGSVVTRDVPDYALVYGNPARIESWVCSCSEKLIFESNNRSVCACGRRYAFDNDASRVSAINV